MPSLSSSSQPWILVRGAGDLASGIILRLHRCGLKVIVTECANPSAIRRKAAFCSAVWDGSATVEGALCRFISDPAEAEKIHQAGEIPLLVDEKCDLAAALSPAAVVDAIMAKKNMGTGRFMAPITVAIGPGFSAGRDVDCVVETMRGHHLGRVIRRGSAISDTGIPGSIGTFTHQRVIHSPADGEACYVSNGAGQKVDIGEKVTKGQLLCTVGGESVCASIDGVLRGLIREGYPVSRGLKIADIDPRPEQAAFCDTVSDKAMSIAGGVLEALLSESIRKGISLF